jgi:phosphoadenosine phosphosulfate reductase
VEDKVGHAKQLIEEAIRDYPKIAVACSFGKDSMVTIHLAREVDPNIDIFAVMTRFKPLETFDYLRKMNESINLGITVYMVADSLPEALKNDSFKVILLPAEEFEHTASQVQTATGRAIYETDPDECCRLLKVDPTKVAVSGLDAWITGLRNTEGRTREDYQETEEKGGLIKINPILTFTETDVWKYMATRGIEAHPWYRNDYRAVPLAQIRGESWSEMADGKIPANAAGSVVSTPKH